ncbi:MAG: ribosome silencing factor [Candidatus Hydrogenedentota bacterium]
MSLIEKVTGILEDAKARDIRVYDVSTLSAFADTLIIATGDADRHIESMAETVRMAAKAEPRHSIEGTGKSGWVLIDTGDIVVHLFTPQRRLYFGLDELWAAGANSNPKS